MRVGKLTSLRSSERVQVFQPGKGITEKFKASKNRLRRFRTKWNSTAKPYKQEEDRKSRKASYNTKVS